MKKILLIIMLVVLVMTISSCDRFISPDTEGKKICEQLLEYMDNDDVEGLKSMFCNTTASLSDFDEQIQDAMGFFEGKIISHDSLVGVSGGGRSVRDGKTMELDISPDIRNILTDADKKYESYFHSYLINAEDSDKEGITYLTIESEDDGKYTIGEYIK